MAGYRKDPLNNSASNDTSNEDTKVLLSMISIIDIGEIALLTKKIKTAGNPVEKIIVLGECASLVEISTSYTSNQKKTASVAAVLRPPHVKLALKKSEHRRYPSFCPYSKKSALRGDCTRNPRFDQQLHKRTGRTGSESAVQGAQLSSRSRRIVLAGIVIVSTAP
ncbi:hypothetical protein EVAR_6779_1 [Eumeta japonica]|uniref:Uncharacterized protein n=1 Tax=Eumeta variegata TaxID=151549 RepID=A0A4C1V3T4_EUMVA|nr:hypothetical protein EVAR_6779_1 [Eumeta japonica]